MLWEEVIGLRKKVKALEGINKAGEKLFEVIAYSEPSDEEVEEVCGDWRSAVKELEEVNVKQ